MLIYIVTKKKSLRNNKIPLKQCIVVEFDFLQEYSGT